MLIFYKNKRGNLSIVILVLLVFMVTAATLFNFITASERVSETIYGAGVVEGIYTKQNLMEFYIRGSGEKAAVDSYRGLVSSGDYIGNPITNFRNEVKFGVLHSGLDENLKIKFTKNLKQEFSNYEFKEDYLINLKQSVLDEKFTVILERGIFKLDLSRQELDNSLENINITYFPKVSLDFNLNRIGLDNFEGVYQAKESCKNKDNKSLIESCFNDNLYGFTSFVEVKKDTNDKNYTFVTLTSKKEFLINKQFKNIEFSFIPA